MGEQFKIGQKVFTNQLIRGWFDYSLQSTIPINTSGIVLSCLSSDNINLMYEIDFGLEFGIVRVHHRNLKS